MKITGYTQQVTNVSGSSSSAPTMSSSAIAKAAATNAVDMTPVAKGLDSFAKNIQKVQEQEDNENVMKAMDAYNKAKFATMYNEENGLMNTKADGAEGIENNYIAQEQEFRSKILGATKLHSRAKQAALDDLMNRSAQQGFQQVARHQYQQKEVALDTNLENTVNTLMGFAQKGYSNADIVNNLMAQAALMVANRYSGVDKSEELKEKATRKYLGNIVCAAIDEASLNENYKLAQDYADAYSDYLTPAQRASIGKTNYAKGKSKWATDLFKDAVTKGIDDPVKFREYIKSQPYFSGTQGTSNAPQEMHDLIGKMGYYDPNNKNNTYCAKAITSIPSLKGTDYEGVTWVPSLMEIAKKNNEWHNGTEGMRPGDIVVVNGDSHVVMMDYNGGTIQNGASGNNGKGGIYASEQSPADMFGKENVTGYIRVQSNSSAAKPIPEEEQDKLVQQFMTHLNNEQRILNMQRSKQEESFWDELYDKAMDGTMSMAEALAKARKDSGGDKKLLRMYENDVHLLFNKANGGPGMGGSGSGQGAGKAAPAYKIAGCKDLLRSGEFKTAQEYADYVGSVGGNLNQIYQARKDFEDYKQSAGEFKYNIGGMIDGYLESNWAGPKIKGLDKAMLKMGLQSYVGQRIAEYRQTKGYDPQKTEIATMIEDGLKTRTFTTQIPGKYAKAWLSDYDVELNSADLKNMGIVKIGDAYDEYDANGNPYGYTDNEGKFVKQPKRVNGQYDVLLNNGTRRRLDSVRLAAMKQGQGY